MRRLFIDFGNIRVRADTLLLLKLKLNLIICILYLNCNNLPIVIDYVRILLVYVQKSTHIK